jgi:hypothetical protein
MAFSMRWWVSAVFLGSATLQLPAQLSMPIGIVRGDVVSWTGDTRMGELDIRNPENTVYSCHYDTRTYFERDHQMIAVAGLMAGDPVEVIADHKPGSAACYARTVQVTEKHAQRLLPGMRPSLRTAYSPTESFAPRGNLTFAGIVVRRGTWLLTLKTRTGEVRLQLRPDTRYMGDGLRMEPAALPVNTHVFVRAGRTLEGDLEAYQVVWGQMLPNNDH